MIDKSQRRIIFVIRWLLLMVPMRPDRIIQFSEFDNKAAIDRALEIGMSYKHQWHLTYYQTFQQEHDGVHPKAETLLSYSASFRQQYCFNAGIN